MAAIAVSMNVEKLTSCNISLRARASTIEVGIRWLTKCFGLKALASTAALAACAACSGATRSMPAPGRSSWAIRRPLVSETRDAAMNQPMILTPTRPIWAGSRDHLAARLGLDGPAPAGLAALD